MMPQPRGSGTAELIIERCVEIIMAAIAAEPDFDRRRDLEESFDAGDWHVQQRRPGFTRICVGPMDVGEHSTLLLRRPDNPDRN